MLDLTLRARPARDDGQERTVEPVAVCDQRATSARAIAITAATAPATAAILAHEYGAVPNTSAASWPCLVTWLGAPPTTGDLAALRRAVYRVDPRGRLLVVDPATQVVLLAGEPRGGTTGSRLRGDVD